MEDALSRPAEVKTDTVWVDFLKVILTVGIVLRHSTLEPSSRAIILLTEVCVPLFFALSGYLFFFHVPERPDIRWFAEKWKRRLFSLVIPYLIANMVAFAIYWSAGRFAPDLVSGFFGDNLRNPFYVLWTGPVNLSLWFIRDLIIAVITTPVIWLLVRYGKFWVVLAYGLLWLFGAQTPWNNFFFMLGSYLAIEEKIIPDICGLIAPYLLLICIGAFVLAPPGGGDAKSLYVLAGLPVCVWGASKYVKVTRIGVDVKWRAWCFFVYLYHYLPLIGIKKILVRMIDPQSDLAWVGIYLASAILVLLLLTGFYLLIRRFLPRVTRIIVGGK